MERREFLKFGAMTAGAVALTGCMTDRKNAVPAAKPGRPRFHVFSKMFQPPVTKSPEELCDLMAAAGFDGVQWTVRKGGHATAENAKVELPRLVKMCEARGLKCESICTDITADAIARPGISPRAADTLRVAADCGITSFRTAYYFYDIKSETFQQSMARFRGGFGKLADLCEKTGVKAAYQNHSSWGPSVFGGLVWDIYECIKDIDPAYIGLEYDPMHAFYETNLSWSHGLELIAPWIVSVDLKDFHYRVDPKDERKMKKKMVGAGAGIVPWRETKRLLDLHGVDPLYIVHFEYDFDKTDLPLTVKRELQHFRGFFSSKNGK